MATGNLEKYTVWDTDTTEITLRLNGDNHKIFLEVRYRTKDERLLALEEQVKTQQQQSAF